MPTGQCVCRPGWALPQEKCISAWVQNSLNVSWVIVTPNLLENRNSMRERTSSTATGRSTGPWIPSSDKSTKVLMVRVALLAQKGFSDLMMKESHMTNVHPRKKIVSYIYIRMLRDFLHTHTHIYICTPCRVRLKRTRKTLPPVSGSVVEFQQWLEDHLHQSFKKWIGDAKAFSAEQPLEAWYTSRNL